MYANGREKRQDRKHHCEEGASETNTHRSDNGEDFSETLWQVGDFF